jgi:hypothetical protein
MTELFDHPAIRDTGTPVRISFSFCTTRRGFGQPQYTALEFSNGSLPLKNETTTASGWYLRPFSQYLRDSCPCHSR